MSEYMSKHVEVKCLGLAINDMNLQAIRILWLPLYIKRFEIIIECLDSASSKTNGNKALQ